MFEIKWIEESSTSASAVIRDYTFRRKKTPLGMVYFIYFKGELKFNTRSEIEFTTKAYRAVTYGKDYWWL